MLGARMLAVDGQVQREGAVNHILVRRLHDLSGLLDGLSERDAGFALPHGRDDEVRGGGPDVGDATPPAVKVRDIFIPDLSLPGIRTKPRDFR